MKRKLPAILTLLVMVLIGAMHWIDISYYTNEAGFVTRGEVWMRYVVLILPFVMGLLGLRIVGPRAIAVMRLRNHGLAIVFMLSAVINLIYGIMRVSASIGIMVKADMQQAVPLFDLLLGLLFIWCAVWLFLAALQLFSQFAPSPTSSALLGILAALPYCMLTIQRILTKPTGLYRISPMIRNFAALFVMLWMGLLLRSLYISLTRHRVRLMYLCGVFTFLFAGCLEMPQTIHAAIFGSATAFDVVEAMVLGFMGILAGCVSVVIAKEGGAKPVEEVYYKQTTE